MAKIVVIEVKGGVVTQVSTDGEPSDIDVQVVDHDSLEDDGTEYTLPEGFVSVW